MNGISKKLEKITFVLLGLVLLSGCVKNTAGTAKSVCGIKTVTISKRDRLTEETAATIEGNNRYRSRFKCGS